MSKKDLAAIITIIAVVVGFIYLLLKLKEGNVELKYTNFNEGNFMRYNNVIRKAWRFIIYERR